MAHARMLRHGARAAVLMTLVGTTGAVALAAGPHSSGQGSVPFQAMVSAQVSALATGAPASVSADVPLVNPGLEAHEINSLAASRSQARAALSDGEGVTFTVTVDGESTPITSDAATLGEALEQAGIAIGWDDQVSADLSAAVEEGAEVHIGRATTSYVTEVEVTEFQTEERETDELEVGESRVVTEGVDGDARVTYAVSEIDGVEVSREVLVSTVLSEARDEVIEIGTAEPAPVVAEEESSGTSTGSTFTGGGDSASNRVLGQEMAAARGWTGSQWSCLDSLWQRESNWNHLAQNPSSGAYGIPQSLPASKMATVGSDWATNPATQITWGLDYIAGRYGTPCGAWAHSESVGWY
ncbi:G5 domain-containing protein [Serinibacter salmoneus]|uniref:Transglycosylase-like protein with SLT domain n=1 Tax=Serinibacter salmoneus TaxID=556530 RepID=A0A2A9D2L6_9MICO|nr:G5 domain-containing protein [Serinibacter salmoneus]PFG20485.1 transglycosylase-like protein with SLT domain [Serinibacter salmoneus]